MVNLSKMIFKFFQAKLTPLEQEKVSRYTLDNVSARKTLFLLLTLFSLNDLFPQSVLQDSLELVFEQTENDSLSISKMMESANYYRNRDAALHLYVINQGIKRTAKIGNKKEEANFIRELGIYYRKRGELDSAITQYNQSLDMHQKLKDSFNVNIVKNSLANAYKAKGDFETAIGYFNDALIYFESKGPELQMRCLITKFNLAGVYISMKEWSTADTLLESLYCDPLSSENKVLLRAIAINLCATKQELNQLDQALDYAELARNLDNDPRSLADLNINIGTIYEKKKEYEKANDFYLKGLGYYKSLKSLNGIILANNNLGNNALHWGRYQQAESHLLEAQSLLNENENLKSLSHNQQMLAELYERTGDYKKSLNYLKKNVLLNDSILGIEKQEAIAKLEVKYETDRIKRDKEMVEERSKTLVLENQKNRGLLMASMLITILVLISGYFYTSRTKAQKKASLTALELSETKRRLVLEQQYKNSELKALKAQMNPHFIFNALNSVQEYIITNNKSAASEYLGRFAHLIRRYLAQSESEYIAIEEEIDSLQTYLSLEALRFESDFKYSLSLSEALEGKSYGIPTMLIQPFVENAITHGLLHKKGKRTLVISFTKGKGETLLCLIEDNGVGREFTKQLKEKKNSHHQSFSIAAIEERLSLFAEKTNELIEYTIVDLKEKEKPSGTQVRLTLPIKKIR